MKVVCKDKKGKIQSPVVDWQLDKIMYLTPGKSYDVIKMSDKYYTIVDDKNTPQTCSRYLFKTIEELRDEKINIIIS